MKRVGRKLLKRAKACARVRESDCTLQGEPSHAWSLVSRSPANFHEACEKVSACLGVESAWFGSDLQKIIWDKHMLVIPKKDWMQLYTVKFLRTWSWLGVTLQYKKLITTDLLHDFCRLFSRTRVDVDPNISRLCYHGNDINYHTSGLVCLHHWAGSMSLTLGERPAAMTNCTNPHLEEDRNLNDLRPAFSRTSSARYHCPWEHITCTWVHG